MVECGFGHVLLNDAPVQQENSTLAMSPAAGLTGTTLRAGAIVESISDCYHFASSVKGPDVADSSIREREPIEVSSELASATDEAATWMKAPSKWRARIAKRLMPRNDTAEMSW